ncbi:MAG: hypothetical protein K2P84_00045 [Undibacterium sp.]|nr:hypothetical protein [Undibacterium sp.]
MTIQVSSTAKQAKSTITKNLLDAGTGAARIELYSDPRTAIDAHVTATLLATITLDDPCGTVDEDGLHLVASTTGQALVDGIVTWGRATDSDGHAVFSGTALQFDDVNVATAAFVIDKAQVYAGGFIVLAQATLSEGG